ncbi:elicitor-responsive protein 1-like protein [Tanacetum coccineum]
MTSDGVLEVTLVDSEDIRAKKFLGCIMSCACSTSAVKRPYVCVEYGEQKRVSKVAAGKGKKSIWDQKFEFEIDYSPEEKKSSQKLVFRVMDKHKLSDDEYIGEARGGPRVPGFTAEVHKVQINEVSKFEGVYVYSKPNESWLFEVRELVSKTRHLSLTEIDFTKTNFGDEQLCQD